MLKGRLFSKTQTSSDFQLFPISVSSLLPLLAEWEQQRMKWGRLMQKVDLWAHRSEVPGCLTLGTGGPAEWDARTEWTPSLSALTQAFLWANSHTSGGRRGPSLPIPHLMACLAQRPIPDQSPNEGQACWPCLGDGLLQGAADGPTRSHCRV